MSNLTKSQINCFARFALRVEEFLNANSKPTKNGHRSLTAKLFEVIMTICFRPAKLASVQHDGLFLQNMGRTKRCSQLRYPEVDDQGNPHPKAGRVILFNGLPRYSEPYVQMFTAKVFRAWRTEQTGLETPEPTYLLAWDKLSMAKQQRIAESFPAKEDGKPEFVPQFVSILLRHGNKPEEGEKRHAWQRLMFLVIGRYGEFGLCIIPNAVVWQSGCIEKLAELIECPKKDIPVWAVKPVAKVEQPLAQVANAVMTNDGIDYDF